MGKVVSIATARKRSFFRPAVTTNQEQGRNRPPLIHWMRACGRAVMRIALRLLRALCIGCVDVLTSILLFLRRPVNFICKLGFISLLFVILVEGMNHWRDRQVVVMSITACFGCLLALGFYDSFSSIVLRLGQTLKGEGK